MKMTYKLIAQAIYKKAREEKLDVRNMIREWVGLFEGSRVVGWNRDKFLDECEIEQIKLNKEKENE